MTRIEALILDSSEDALQIDRFLAGDGEAFDGLVGPYLSRFTIGIHRILQDDQDTEDALNRALFTMHTELHHSLGRRKFSTWAFRICLDEALTTRRARARTQEYQGFQKEDGERLWMRIGLTRLSEAQRSVFILIDLEGRETEAVAKIMNRPRGWVRKHLREARQGLRGVLAGSAGDPWRLGGSDIRPESVE